MANSYSLVVLVAVFRTEVAIELLLISGSNTLMIYFFLDQFLVFVACIHRIGIFFRKQWLEGVMFSSFHLTEFISILTMSQGSKSQKCKTIMLNSWELSLIFYLILQQSIRNLSAAVQQCLHWQHRALRRPLPLKTGTTWQVQRAQFVLQLLIVILKACLLTCCHPSLVNPFWLKFIMFFSAMHSPFV